MDDFKRAHSEIAVCRLAEQKPSKGSDNSDSFHVELHALVRGFKIGHPKRLLNLGKVKAGVLGFHMTLLVIEY